MKRIYILNEFNLPGFIFRSLSGQKPIVAYINPALPGTGGMLRRVVRALDDKGCLDDPFEAFPSWKRFQMGQGGAEAYSYYTDLFMKTEPWYEKNFNFAGLDAAFPDYAQASRHRICSHYPDTGWLVFALHDVKDRGDMVWHGVFPELRGIYQTYYGEAVPAWTESSLELRWLINAAQGLIIMAFVIGWTIGRVRLTPPRPKHYFLGADLLQVLRHLYVTREMVDDKKDCLIVFRAAEFQKKFKDRIEGLDSAMRFDGVVTMAMLPAMLWQTVRDIIRLYVRFGGTQGGLFRRIGALVKWRMIYRALFRRYTFDYFLGRDDYNGDHSMRTQELHRIGGVSLGISHGLPTCNTIHSDVRFLDFDIYFTFGIDLYETYYKDTYAPGMKVVAIGSIGLRRELFARLNEPRPNNIVVYVADDSETALLIDMMVSLAEKFDDRKIIVKIKESQFDHGTADLFVQAIENGPENLIDDRRDPYEIMLDGQFAISNDSTVAVECISYGMVTFIYDRYAETQVEPMALIYRDYPDLCYNNVAAIEDRIRTCEAGTWRYRRENFAKLVDISGRNPYDIIRTELGLMPKDPFFTGGLPKDRSPEPVQNNVPENRKVN